MNWSHSLINTGIYYINMGLATGLIGGLLLAARPVLLRLVSPRQRLFLWMTAWLSVYLPAWYTALSWIHLLPVTFRDLITPRTSEFSYSSIPAYLPTYRGEGKYCLALPGGLSVPVTLEPWMLAALLLVAAGGIILSLRFFSRGTQQLKAQAAQGRLLDWDGPELRCCGRKPAGDTVRVRLCSGLPTSFVYQKGEAFDHINHGWSKASGRTRYDMIYLQEELPSDRRALVLCHEINHLKLHHPWMKGVITCGLVLHWWNPLLWLAHKYTCLDMELDCDQATLEQLDPEQRKEYAKTLVDLGTGRQLWDAPLAFGESSAIPRVRAAVAWRRPHPLRRCAAWVVFAAVLLFLLGGPSYRIFSADIDLQITEQFHSPAAFVRQDSSILRQKGALPSALSIQESWRHIQEDGLLRMAYLLPDSRWVESVWIYFSGELRWSHWDVLSHVPDPAEYQRYYLPN